MHFRVTNRHSAGQRLHVTSGSPWTQRSVCTGNSNTTRRQSARQTDVSSQTDVQRLGWSTSWNSLVAARQEEDATVDLSFNLATIRCLLTTVNPKKRYLRDTDRNFSFFPSNNQINVQCIEFRISKLVLFLRAWFTCFQTDGRWGYYSTNFMRREESKQQYRSLSLYSSILRSYVLGIKRDLHTRNVKQR